MLKLEHRLVNLSEWLSTFLAVVDDDEVVDGMSSPPFNVLNCVMIITIWKLIISSLLFWLSSLLWHDCDRNSSDDSSVSLEPKHFEALKSRSRTMAEMCFNFFSAVLCVFCAGIHLKIIITIKWSFKSSFSFAILISFSSCRFFVQQSLRCFPTSECQ